jgi:hypothetical protein
LNNYISHENQLLTSTFEKNWYWYFESLFWPEQINRIKDRDKDLWEKIKATRNKFLMETDWTEISYNTDIDLYGIPSNIIDKPMKKLYEKYRQELRDIPQKYNDPKDVIFPMTPQAILRELELLKIERELIEKEQKEIQKQEIKRITTSSDKLV